jgi:8-amino-3,8-dideoxy-alpha-D-manno-octulosonate transaminase
MSELTAAVACHQLRKLPRIIRHMRASKGRVKARLAGTPGLSFRRLNDEAGDTGPFLVLVLDDEAAAAAVVERLHASGLHSAVRLSDYGLHIYYNVPQLVHKVPLSPAGNPWALPQNQPCCHDYRKGACPQSDGLFARSVLVPIPSRLSAAQEEAAAEIIGSAVLAAGSPMAAGQPS